MNQKVTHDVAAPTEQPTVVPFEQTTIVAPQPTVLPSAGQTSSSDSKYFICDQHFIDDLNQLKALRSYMIRQAKSAELGKIELGDLNMLRFREVEKGGRWPTGKEYAALEQRSNDLYQRLTETDRRRFLFSQTPSIVVGTAAVLGVAALGSLLVAVMVAVAGSGHGPAILMFLFLTFLVWVATLGAIGSIAFIGMNALAVQEDVTFDITNKKLIFLRLVLGALFAVVLTLPFGFEPFIVFIGKLATTSDMGHPDSETASALVSKSILLLLPFILGFSTTVVIMILNRFVEAIQTFFGARSTSSSADATQKGLLATTPQTVSPASSVPPTY
jgi:hypothetical protein